MSHHQLRRYWLRVRVPRAVLSCTCPAAGIGCNFRASVLAFVLPNDHARERHHQGISQIHPSLPGWIHQVPCKPASHATTSLMQGPKRRRPGTKSLYGDLVNREVMVPAHIFGEDGASYAARVLKPDTMHRGCMVVKVGIANYFASCNRLQLDCQDFAACPGWQADQAHTQWLLVATMLYIVLMAACMCLALQVKGMPQRYYFPAEDIRAWLQLAAPTATGSGATSQAQQLQQEEQQQEEKPAAVHPEHEGSPTAAAARRQSAGRGGIAAVAAAKRQQAAATSKKADEHVLPAPGPAATGSTRQGRPAGRSRGSDRDPSAAVAPAAGGAAVDSKQALPDQAEAAAGHGLLRHKPLSTRAAGAPAVTAAGVPGVGFNDDLLGVILQVSRPVRLPMHNLDSELAAHERGCVSTQALGLAHSVSRACLHLELAPCT